MPLLAEMQSRGLVHQVSDPQLDEKLRALGARRPIAAYCGFDPSANSLHVGNFVAIRGLMFCQRNGIPPIGIVGSATGLIGDPSGKANERPLLTKQAIADNAEGIGKVLAKFLDFHHATAPAKLVNNLDWMGPMSAIDFLRDVGKHFRIGSMLAKDSVKARMDTSDEGMSYTEFSYQLLQAYDFYRLYKDHNCVLQVGGSDQWGNITAGTDLIRKLEGESGSAYALTMPLITDSRGEKVGKTQGKAVWLTADRTSVFDFYQYWLRTEDADVARYLRFFTFLPLTEIDTIMAEHRKAPEKRLAQRTLADDVTNLVHGRQATQAAVNASQTLYSSGVEQLDASAVEALGAQGVPTTTVPRAQLETGWPLLDAAVAAGLAKSKGEARRLVAQGGLYVNNIPATDPNATLTPADLVANAAVVLRSGKKNYRLVRPA